MWIRMLKMGKKVSNYMRVCSLHFTESDFLQKGKEPANFSGTKPDAEQLTFTFYEEENSEPVVYRTTSSSFDISPVLTVCIIPDHNENSKTEWVEKLRVTLFKKYSVVNVIIVDWTIAASDPNTAKDNTKFVGDNLATFITNVDVPGYQVILIGLGLGAHIAGFTGKAYKSQNSGQKLLFIIALDPAAAGFEVERGSKTKIPDTNKLVATDASIVSCTHTNCHKYGVKAAICTVDFYVNDGNIQPGCTGDKGKKDKCSHTRAAEVFIGSFEVLNAKAEEAYVTVLKDKVLVKPKTQHYGINIGPTTTGIYQIKTTSASPYLIE